MVQVVRQPNQTDLRFWFYEPAAYSTAPLSEKRDLDDKIRGAGFKTVRWGIRSRIAAHKLAMDVERATGVPMKIQQHDYL